MRLLAAAVTRNRSLGDGELKASITVGATCVAAMFAADQCAGGVGSQHDHDPFVTQRISGFERNTADADPEVGGKVLAQDRHEGRGDCEVAVEPLGFPGELPGLRSAASSLGGSAARRAWYSI